MHRLKSAAAAALLMAAAAPASALTVIDFEGVGASEGVGDIAGTFAEDGFTLDFDRMFLGQGSSSTPTYEVERQGGTTGTLTLTRGGDPFLFSSVDRRIEVSTIPADITLEGYSGAALLGADTFTSASTDDATFEAVALAGVAIDRLVIRPDRTAGLLGAFDAVVLDASVGAPSSDVPAPAAGGLLAAALGGLALLRRRRRARG